jgi:hypothetical protein
MKGEHAMDNSTEAPICGCCRRVPVSHLSLDLDEPVSGWMQFLAERNIEVASDHLGRASVARWVVADLLDEQREREARLAEEAAARAATLVQPVPVGIPALERATAYETMMSASGTSPADEFGSRPRPNFLAEELEEGQRRQAAEREAVRQRKEKAK